MNSVIRLYAVNLLHFDGYRMHRRREDIISCVEVPDKFLEVFHSLCDRSKITAKTGNEYGNFHKKGGAKGNFPPGVFEPEGSRRFAVLMKDHLVFRSFLVSREK